jgi:uncharacterized membrane protein
LPVDSDLNAGQVTESFRGALTENLQRASVAINRSAPFWIFGCAAFCILLSCLIASVRPLWNDELFTYYIGGQATFSDVWGALATGAEQLPPFFFLITRLFTGIAGHSALALRMSEILGFWIAGNIAGYALARRFYPVCHAVDD